MLEILSQSQCKLDKSCVTLPTRKQSCQRSIILEEKKRQIIIVKIHHCERDLFNFKSTVGKHHFIWQNFCLSPSNETRVMTFGFFGLSENWKYFIFPLDEKIIQCEFRTITILGNKFVYDQLFELFLTQKYWTRQTVSKIKMILWNIKNLWFLKTRDQGINFVMKKFVRRTVFFTRSGISVKSCAFEYEDSTF